MSNKVRTRYAPSPTGFFHIGGARTALFNYLYAKHCNGDFIVRIEDTDIERNVEGGIDSQLNNLTWLKIPYDESIKNPGKFGPYIQSQKLERYRELANKLLQEGKAYYCFCSKEELDLQREIAMKQGHTPKYNRKCLYLSKEEIQEKLSQNISHVIRLKMHDNENIEWDDLIRGHMSVPTSALTDPVILKSNGIPMYNFAVVVDDYDMEITHVLRGEEHLSNTPYQIAIKKALGFDTREIKYGHLSIIIDETGKKLSKRNKTLKQFIQDYKDMGVLPEAITNFLALLGWSSKSNNEILSMDEIIKEFDFDRISKSPAFFDFKKMLWISNSYLKNMNDQDYLTFVKKFLTVDLNKYAKHKDEILLIFKPQIQYGQQINELVTDIFMSDINNLPVELQETVKQDFFKKNMEAFKQVVSKMDVITYENAKDIVDNVKKISGLKGKELFLPMRIACIGKEHGPEMNKILTIIGKDQILKNIDTLTK